MTNKYHQILAINIKPELVSQAALYSEKPIIQAPDATVQLDNYIMQKTDAILVSIYQDLSESFLKKFINLKYIGVLGTSSKKIALNYCENNNIKVSCVYDYCDHETAEWVILQILKFYRDQEKPQSVYEKTLGIVGAGAVGTKLAHKAWALGLQVNFYAPSVHSELVSLGAHALSLEELFKNSSIISFHTPPQVVWLKREFLDQLPEGALLINTCMGKIAADHVLEQFLSQRPDVTLIMDSIAALSYGELKNQSLMSTRSAYETIDSKNRLAHKFLANLAKK
jgi:phosphoglycerate dehydrogenase-like enzyme